MSSLGSRKGTAVRPFVGAIALFILLAGCSGSSGDGNETAPDPNGNVTAGGDNATAGPGASGGAGTGGGGGAGGSSGSGGGAGGTGGSGGGGSGGSGGGGTGGSGGGGSGGSGGGGGAPPPPSNKAPIAEFDVSLGNAKLVPATGVLDVLAGDVLRFNASNSSDPDGDALTYAWMFGNGDSAAGRVWNYSYASAGRFVASLVVSDGRGGSHTTSFTMDVRAVYFQDDAETGVVGWTFTQGAADPGWHRTSASAHGGTMGWTFQDEALGYYHPNEVTTMESPAFGLQDAPTAKLSFWLIGDSAAADPLNWEILHEGAWTELGSQTGTVGDWTQVDVSLDAYLGASVQVRFVFESGASALTNGGFFIDDIVVASR